MHVLSWLVCSVLLDVDSGVLMDALAACTLTVLGIFPQSTSCSTCQLHNASVVAASIHVYAEMPG